MYFNQAVDVLKEQIDAAMQARGIKLEAFPARRHDEQGWMIGHVVSGRVLSDQPQPLIVPLATAALAETEINTFLNNISRCTPTISARLRSVGDITEHVVVNGLWLRFCLYPDQFTIRCDTLIGYRSYPTSDPGENSTEPNHG